MLRAFIIIILLSGCSYLPSKNQDLQELQTMRDEEKRNYKFCVVGSADLNRCPQITVKTPYKTVAAEEVTNNDRENEKTELLGMGIDDDESNKKLDLKLQFLFASTDLYPDSSKELQKKAVLLKGKKILLKGHTDNSGYIETNSKLALERAKKVKKLLTLAGVNASDIRVEARPLCCYLNSNSVEEERKANRRVEIYISE